MKKFIHTLLSLLSLVLLVAVPAFAQTYASFTTASGTPLQLQSDRALVHSVTVLNATAGALNLKLYDSANTTTNYTQAAYNAVIAYRTNYAVITTNLSGVLITNTVAGWYRNTEAVGSTTVLKPKVLDITVPANSIRTYELQMQPAFGLLAHANGVLSVEVKYP